MLGTTETEENPDDSKAGEATTDEAASSLENPPLTVDRHDPLIMEGLRNAIGYKKYCDIQVTV